MPHVAPHDGTPFEAYSARALERLYADGLEPETLATAVDEYLTSLAVGVPARR